MEQGTVNGLASLLGLLAGKVGEDFGQVQQAKLQRMQGLNNLQALLQQNPDYAQNPLVAKQLQSISQQPQASTGELFKKMFFGQTPEMQNMDINMLSQQLDMLDNARHAKQINDTYGLNEFDANGQPTGQGTFRPQDLNNPELLKALNTLNVTNQWTRNIDDDNKRQQAEAWVKNLPELIKLAQGNFQPTGAGTGTGKNPGIGQVSVVDNVHFPAGFDPQKLVDLFSTVLKEEQSNARNNTTQKAQTERTAMQQKGAKERAIIGANTSKENSKRSTGTQLKIAGQRLSVDQQRLKQQAEANVASMSLKQRELRLNYLNEKGNLTKEEIAEANALSTPPAIPTIKNPLPPKPSGAIPKPSGVVPSTGQNTTHVGAKVKGLDEFLKTLQR